MAEVWAVDTVALNSQWNQTPLTVPQALERLDF